MARLKLKQDIFVRGLDGKIHAATFRIREKESKNGYFKRIHRYLYLAYRDGATIKELYVAKLENKGGENA